MEGLILSVAGYFGERFEGVFQSVSSVLFLDLCVHFILLILLSCQYVFYLYSSLWKMKKQNIHNTK